MFIKDFQGWKTRGQNFHENFRVKKSGVRNSRENTSGVIDIFSEMKYFRGDWHFLENTSGVKHFGVKKLMELKTFWVVKISKVDFRKAQRKNSRVDL